MVQDSMKFFSFNKPLDWNKGYAVNLHVQKNGISVAQTEKYIVRRSILPSDLDGVSAVRDFAAGQGGKLFVIDSDAQVWVYDYENKLIEPLFSREHLLFTNEALLASRGDVLYIADAQSERRIAAYSISNGQLLWYVETWRDLELYPLAIAAEEEGYVAAVVPLELIIGVNGNQEVAAGGRIGIIAWNAAGEAERTYEHELLRLEEGSAVADLQHRYNVSVSADDGSVVVLDRARKLIISFHRDGSLKTYFSIAQTGVYAGLSIDTNNNLYVGDRSSPGKEGAGERYLLQYREGGDFQSKVAAFRGRADKLLLDERNRMFVFNKETGVITQLELQARTMVLEQSGLPEAIYFTTAIDSTEAETQWHKIRLEADIPEETQVRISYLASDDLWGIVDGNYVRYTDYLKDDKITLREKLQDTRELWSEPIVNPRDALLVGAVGRYLWLKIEVVGSEQRTPRIEKLRVYFPRASLISYLPAIYQEEDERGNRFLERYLSIFATFFDDMEERIEAIASYFDPDAVSGSYLQWLGNWLAVSEDSSWGEDKLRLLIKQAPALYKLRGTRQGLSRMLQLYTGAEPFIIEYFQFKQMQEKAEMRELFAQLYGDNPYTFCVMLPPESVRTDKQRFIIEGIIEDQKPAFTDGKLIVLQPWMYVDMHTYMGINTVLSEQSLLTLDQRSSMPYNTVLIDVDQDRRIDIHTRLELDSDLE